MASILKHKVYHCINLGLTNGLSPLNLIRFRVINIINYLILIGASLLFIYRVYIIDFISIAINGVLMLLMMINIYLCKKSNHRIAINLTSFYLLALVINLCQSELFISGVVYLSILPMAISLLYKDPINKHLYYLTCAAIFTYFIYYLKMDGTILFTYYIVTFGFYIAFLSFFNLVEKKQQELSEVILKLETQNAELQQFNYITSHDLQEPLGTISSFSQLLSAKYGQQLDEVGSKSLLFIKNAAHQMQSLIKGLLDYSLIGNSSFPEPIIIQELIKNIRKELHATLLETNTTIIVDDIPMIFGYKAEIQALLQNLIINAIKFRQPNINPIIRISVQEKDDFWQFSVKDNGIGMAPEHLTKIFDMFRRIHTKDKYSGNGIGLSHCKKIVHLHFGKIWVESTLHHGSIFYFTIKV